MLYNVLHTDPYEHEKKYKKQKSKLTKYASHTQLHTDYNTP